MKKIITKIKWFIDCLREDYNQLCDLVDEWDVDKGITNKEEQNAKV